MDESDHIRSRGSRGADVTAVVGDGLREVRDLRLDEAPSRDEESPLRVVVVERDGDVVERVAEVLAATGYEIEIERVDRVSEVFSHLEPPPDVVLARDPVEPDVAGVEVVSLVEQWASGVPVVLLADQLDVASVVERMQRGAADVVDRASPERLGSAIVQIAERRWLEREHRLALSALHEVELRYRELLDNANDIVYAHDLDGRFLIVNRAGQEVTGYDLRDLSDLNVWDLVAPESRATVEEAFADAAEGRPIPRIEIEIVRKDGRRVPVEASPRGVHRDGELVAIEGIARDMTERKTAEARTTRLVEALRRTDAQRSRLLRHLGAAQEEERRSIASDIHDDSIQTMVVVGMRLGMLRQRLSRSASPVEASVLTDITKLESVVGEAIARLRDLIFELRPPSLDSGGLVRATTEHLTHMEEETGIAFEVEDHLSDEPEPEVRTIAFRILQEAFANVRKHSEASEVRVRFDGRTHGFLVTVRDDGRGLSEHDLDQPAPGHLGLAGMRERCELAGGWWRIDGRPEGGTVVEFWLPLRADADPPPGTAIRRALERAP